MSSHVSLWDKIRAFFTGPVIIEAKDDDPPPLRADNPDNRLFHETEEEP